MHLELSAASLCCALRQSTPGERASVVGQAGGAGSVREVSCTDRTACARMPAIATAMECPLSVAMAGPPPLLPYPPCYTTTNSHLLLIASLFVAQYVYFSHF